MWGGDVRMCVGAYVCVNICFYIRDKLYFDILAGLDKVAENLFWFSLHI